MSSGLPPAGIAVVRVSGPEASAVLGTLAGTLPMPRLASVRSLHDPTGRLLDQALVLWLPGPRTVTGEDMAELHLHGGRAVVDAVLGALSALPALRAAEAGEFTRRALLNGRIDLTEAEGLADLLSAETAAQHRQALALSGGALGLAVQGWQTRLLNLSAQTEAMLDFGDEDDVAADAATSTEMCIALKSLTADLAIWLAVPRAERLRDGIDVVIAGPPNIGKSTLINALAEREAAIVSPVAGTTRDIIEVQLALDGIPFRFADTAGLHAEAGDAIELIGMARARERIAAADLVLWLGPIEEAVAHPGLLRIAAQTDVRPPFEGADVALSARTGEGMATLRRLLIDKSRQLIPREGEVALNRRQYAELSAAHDALADANPSDALLLAEALRIARLSFDRLTGRAGTEAMLDALFGRFCIGK